MFVRPHVPIFVRRLVKATKFWQDNYLILREFRHFKAIAITALVCTLFSAFLEGITIGFISSFLQGLTNPNEPPIQSGVQWIDVWFLATNSTPSKRVYRLSVLILFAIWLKTLLDYCGKFYSRVSELNLADLIRKRIFFQLQNFRLSYYNTTRSGELVNTLITEVKELRMAFNSISVFLTRGSTLVAYVFAMLWISWQLSVISIMLFLLLSVVLSRLIAKVREASFAVPTANGALMSKVTEFISSIRTVKASAKENFEKQLFYEVSLSTLTAEAKVYKFGALVQPLAEGLSGTILILMVVFAFNYIFIDGNLTAASLLTFMFILFRMRPLVAQVNQAGEEFNRFQGSLSNIKNLLRTDNKPYLKNGKIKFVKLRKSIDFVDVDFGYQDNELTLHNINLSIPKGKTTALVGASGAGKSTLIDLIPRFYDSNKGYILVDDIDIRHLDIYSLRENIGIVSQDTFIFNASVRDNIAYGIKKIDEKAIWEVIRLANASEFIRRLPQGLDTVLGDRGVQLSGGQRQRLAIARALLRNPEILILDEATSALDSVTERQIQESLESLSQGKTVIAIAHRLSTIAKADKVVVLERGRVVEEGSYQQLLAKGGKLWNYHQIQQQLASEIT